MFSTKEAVPILFIIEKHFTTLQSLYDFNAVITLQDIKQSYRHLSAITAIVMDGESQSLQIKFRSTKQRLYETLSQLTYLQLNELQESISSLFNSDPFASLTPHLLSHIQYSALKLRWLNKYMTLCESLHRISITSPATQEEYQKWSCRRYQLTQLLHTTFSHALHALIAQAKRMIAVTPMGSLDTYQILQQIEYTQNFSKSLMVPDTQLHQVMIEFNQSLLARYKNHHPTSMVINNAYAILLGTDLSPTPSL